MPMPDFIRPGHIVDYVRRTPAEQAIVDSVPLATSATHGVDLTWIAQDHNPAD